MNKVNTHANASSTGDARGVYTRRSIPTVGLSRGRQSVRGFAIKEAVIRLKCETHMSNTEIAEAIGRSRQWVGRVWRTAVREAEQAAIDPEKKQELKAWMIHQVMMAIVKAQNHVDESAAYGMLVLKGVEQLRALLGVDEVSGCEDKNSLQEIAKQVDIRSPLVMIKLEGISSSESDTEAKTG